MPGFLLLQLMSVVCGCGDLQNAKAGINDWD